MIVKIDKKDKKIIHFISNNARESDSQIAKAVGLSRGAVTYRINRLEKLKIIKKYLTWINTFELGYPSFHIYLKIKNFTKEKRENILKIIKSNPNVKWLVSSGWAYDFFFVMAVKDTKDLDIKLKELYANFEEDILKTKIHIVESIVKEVPPFFSELIKFPKIKEIQPLQKSPKIDRVDIEILNLLSENARMNVIEIKTKLEKDFKPLTPEAISYRIKKLQKNGVIKKFSAAIDYQKIGMNWVMIIFKFNKITKDFDNKIKLLFKADKRISYVDKTADHRIKFHILAYNFEEIHNIISEIRNKFDKHIEKYEIIPLFEEHVLTTIPKGVYLDLIKTN